MTGKSKEKKKVAKRDGKGRFVKGASGNPAGRPIGTRNQITTLRENTELALREYLATTAAQTKAHKAIDRCMNIALDGDDKQAIQAMKLIFDKIMPNARPQEDKGSEKQTPVAIQIVNQTAESAGQPVKVVVDGEFEEVS